MKRTSQMLAATFGLTSATAHASSLPQMDPTWYPNQLFWLAVSFIALYTLVALCIAPRIAAILATRSTAIAEAIREAEKAKRTADSTRATIESSGTAARTKAGETVAAAQAEIQKDAANALHKLDRELAAQANHAQARLDDALAAAKSGVVDAANHLATAMTTQLTTRTPSANS